MLSQQGCEERRKGDRPQQAPLLAAAGGERQSRTAGSPPRRTGGGIGFWKCPGTYFFIVVLTFYPLSFFLLNFLMRKSRFSFCSIKVSNVMIKRWLIQTHVFYSCFCAEMTVSFRRELYVLFSFSKTRFFSALIHSAGDYAVLMAGFAGQHALSCWGLGKFRKAGFRFSQMCELYGSKTIFWA